jgi:hypothetical protein
LRLFADRNSPRRARCRISSSTIRITSSGMPCYPCDDNGPVAACDRPVPAPWKLKLYGLIAPFRGSTVDKVIIQQVTFILPRFMNESALIIHEMFVRGHRRATFARVKVSSGSEIGSHLEWLAGASPRLFLMDHGVSAKSCHKTRKQTKARRYVPPTFLSYCP